MLSRRGATLEEMRYEDSKKVCFVPEAGEEFFSGDDVRRVVGMLHTARRPLSGGRPGRGGTPGPGPYDTGAV
jgi:hypothetical protein